MLQPLAELAKQPLEWKCVGITDASWDLRAAGQVAGTLRIAALGTSGQAEIAPTKWKIFRMGLFGGVRVLKEGAHKEAASFSQKWYRGRVKLDTGRELEWGPTNFWATRWAFTSDSRQVVMEFHKKGWLGRLNTVTVSPEARGAGDLGVLLVLGQFLMLKGRRAH